MDAKNILIAQSGGPSSAINASIAGATARAMGSEKIKHVLGAVNGMKGFLDRKIINVSKQITSSDDFDLLIHTPAQALGSSRYKLPKDEESYERVLGILKEYNIGYFFYNGGNDSMDTVARLANYFKLRGEEIAVIGIPKTIDNDLMETDHTPGFGSAARYVAASVGEVYLDTIVYPKPAVTIVEIMGRNAGWLTAASALARQGGIPAPQLIYLPEVIFDPENFVKRVQTQVEKDMHVVVAVSEGVRLADGSYLSIMGDVLDMFGHKTLGGAALALEEMVKTGVKIENLKTRTIQFSSLQRSAAHLASMTDLNESYECGYLAVEAALNGMTGVMVAIHRTGNNPYITYFDYADVNLVANKEKHVPREWITMKGTNVSQEMIDYLLPLVRGDASERMEGGLPRFFRFNHSDTVSPDEVS
ncbi:MAG: 6-phosphofructokinase [Clostridiales Family XIII bacterium]|nr:6-phosphofructokinase [Clostridiales Family XIII bacterium]